MKTAKFLSALQLFALTAGTALANQLWVNPLDGAETITAGTYGAITTSQDYGATNLGTDFTVDNLPFIDTTIAYVDHTLSFWFKPTDNSGGSGNLNICQLLSDPSNLNSADEYNILQTTGNELQIDFENDSSVAGGVITSSALTPGTWYHIAITLDADDSTSPKSGTAAIYINGAQDVTSTPGQFNIQLNGNTSAIDSRITFYSGQTLAGLYLDSTLLSAADIQAKAVATLDTLGSTNEPALVLYNPTAQNINLPTTNGIIGDWNIIPDGGYDGTNASGVTALQFNGTSTSSIDLGTTASLDGTENFTLSVVAKVDVGTDGTLITQRTLASAFDGQMRFYLTNTGNLVFWLYDAGAAQTLTSTLGGYNNGEWHHFVVVREGTAATLYIDGMPAGSNTTDFGGALDVSNNVGIGNDIRDKGTPLTGLLDEVAIYKSALTESEVRNLYPNFTPTFGLTVEQIGSELFWQVEKEVGVKLYRIIDRQTGETLAEVPAGKTSYTYDLGAAKDVLLVVVDTTGFTQSFAPTAEDSVVLNLTAGWNLVSAPFATTADQFTNASVWAWHPETKAYQSIDSIPAQQAVWVFTAAADTLVLTGTIAPTTLELTAGWNLYGPSENCEAPAHLHIYDWQQNYQITDYLTVGNGYWIYTETAQSLLLP